MSADFRCTVPILRMFNVEKAKEFYVGFLGFKVDWEHQFEPNTPVYMQISRDGLYFHLSEHHGDGSPGVHVRIRCDDLEAFHAEISAKKYKNYRPGLQDQEWGTREMVVKDGAGNQLVFFRDLK